MLPMRRKRFGQPATFDELMGNMFGHFLEEFGESKIPRVNVKNEEDRYLIEAEVPGLNKEEINLYYDKGVLIIEGDKKEENKIEKENYVSKEISTQKYQRKINLNGANIDEENIKAELENGILCISVPKKEPEKENSKQIDIN